MNIDDYLKQINCLDYKSVSLNNLKKLQSNNLKRFAFENLDMHLGKKINFSIEDSYDKLMNKSRGGYCLQLNPVFSWLLKELGYEHYLTPCFIYNMGFKKWNRLPIHVIIIVKLEGKLYYVDVGISRILNEPIEVLPEVIQVQPFGTYRFSKSEDDFYILDRCKVNSLEWTHQIKFKLEPKELEYFRKMNDYVQTPEHPTMYYRTFVSKHIGNSIVSLNGWNYLEIRFDEQNTSETRYEKVLTNEEVKDVLKNKFCLDIDNSFEPKFDDFSM